MVFLAATFPLFRFGTEGVRSCLGWPCYGAGLVLTAAGMIYCARARRSPGVGGISCVVAALIIGFLACVRYGLPSY